MQQLSSAAANYEQQPASTNLQQLLISNSCLRNLSNKYNSIINASKSSRLYINGKKLKENRVRSAAKPASVTSKLEEDEEEDLNIWNYNPYEIKVSSGAAILYPTAQDVSQSWFVENWPMESGR